MEIITIFPPYKLLNSSAAQEPIDIEVGSYRQVSDGYHTIAELYDHRVTLWIALCKMKSEKRRVDGELEDAFLEDYDKSVWRSLLHSDGSRFDDWFLLGIFSEPGKMMTYHVPISRWNETDFAVTLEKGHFDGHTSADVLERLKSL